MRNDNDNPVRVQLRTVYGRDLIYPVCPQARRFAELTGRKTLHESDLKLIQELGFVIDWVPQSINLTLGGEE